MKKLIYLLPILMFMAGCVKTDTAPSTPLVPYGSFAGKITHVYPDPSTNTKITSSANIQLVMTTSGFTLISDAEAVHANSLGDFLGNELTIEFKDSTYPTIAPPISKAYLNGVYNYAYDGTTFRIFKQSGDESFDYTLTKK